MTVPAAELSAMTNRMKAFRCSASSDSSVLELVDREVREPKDNEVMARVVVSVVDLTDWGGHASTVR